MTILLKPEIEARLRERARQDGQTAEEWLNAFLADALSDEADDPDDLTEDEKAEMRAVIERGLQAAAEGRERPLEDYIADVRKRRTQ